MLGYQWIYCQEIIINQVIYFEKRRDSIKDNGQHGPSFFDNSYLSICDVVLHIFDILPHLKIS
jgi:hypothetical protein